MSESSDGVKEKGHRAKRKERAKCFETTVIKTGLQRFCREPLVIDLIERAVQTCARVSWEASLFASFHVLRCLHEDLQVDSLDQNFWNQCISAIANGQKGIPETATQKMKDSFAAFILLRPADYVPVQREGYMGHIFEGLRETMLTNFETVFGETFNGRLCRWLRLKVLESERNTLQHDSVIKSVVALLNAACLNQDGSVVALHPSFRRLQTLTEEDINFLSSVVAEVRNSIGGPIPLSKDSEVIPTYFPFLRKILADIEHHHASHEKCFTGIKAFSILPQKTFRAPFIHISTTVLKALATALRGRKKKNEEDYDFFQSYMEYLLKCVDDDDLWREFFDLKLVVKGKKQFANSIKTDGISVSVTVELPRKGDPIPAKGIHRKRALEKLEKEDTSRARKTILEKCRETVPARVVAIDPGVKAPITAVVYSPEAVATLTRPHGSNTHFETFAWSASKWYRECGITRKSREMRKWTAAAPDVLAFNASLTSAKTSSLEVYCNRVTSVLSALPMLLDFYVHKRRVRRSRWYGYQCKQAATENIIADVADARNHRAQKDVLVAYGNASMNNMRGCKPVVQKALHHRLRKRCMLLDVDEFRTSKLCCCCLEAMEGKQVYCQKEQKTKRLYGVRRCENSACHRIFWSRDNNGAINILMKALRFLRGEEDPQQFSRTFNPVGA